MSALPKCFALGKAVSSGNSLSHPGLTTQLPCAWLHTGSATPLLVPRQAGRHMQAAVCAAPWSALVTANLVFRGAGQGLAKESYGLPLLAFNVGKHGR